MTVLGLMGWEKNNTIEVLVPPRFWLVLVWGTTLINSKVEGKGDGGVKGESGVEEKGVGVGEVGVLEEGMCLWVSR